MTFQQTLALAAFAFVTSITPGPNNLMLMASGATFGVRRTVPHAFGVALGFTVMVILVGSGLIGLFAAAPWLDTVLQAASVAYMLVLAWKIATAPPPEKAVQSRRPMTFFAAAAFQWINPKAWTMALTAITVYAPTQSWAVVAAVAAIFGLVNFPSVGVWAVLGQQMRRVLTNPRSLRIFNLLMATLLVASLYPILAH